MAALVKKYRLKVRCTLYNYENDEMEEKEIELAVRDAPYFSEEEEQEIERKFDASYVSNDVEILDSWYEFV